MPGQARRGDLVEIRTLIAHPMESGYRRDAMGEAIPRDILTRFECRYGGETVFRMELHPAIAANPYLSFFVEATRSATLEFEWTDQDGQSAVHTAALEVVEA
jgi:sulfur-oxidizing protein SoxZ